MTTCSVCGNESDRAFTVATADGLDHSYDSIECAAHDLAPRCPHCGCQILGHGAELNGSVFCCRHCAEVTTATAGASQRNDSRPS